MEQNSFLLKSFVLLTVGLLIGLLLPHILAIPFGEVTGGMINIIFWTTVVGALGYYLGSKLGESILWIIWPAAISGGAMFSDFITVPLLDSIISDSGSIGWMVIATIMASFVSAILFKRGMSREKWYTKQDVYILLFFIFVSLVETVLNWLD